MGGCPVIGGSGGGCPVIGGSGGGCPTIGGSGGGSVLVKTLVGVLSYWRL